MKTSTRRCLSVVAITICVAMALFLFSGSSRFETSISAQTNPTPTPAVVEFDQKAALAKLREQIKGKEKEPSSTVFKNIQTMKDRPAAQLLAVMEFGYSRSLGVTCTHCHVADKWESEDKPTKQVAREMSTMVGKINGEMLKGIKNLKSASPTINCTTCHRGQVVPALNLPTPKAE
ncbi:MAG TPA: c-type cytochrome [Pyrinomonadaceae bacterium]|nr:c-type cytochrome [Pyrinomonadaceae bacterium]